MSPNCCILLARVSNNQHIFSPKSIQHPPSNQERIILQWERNAIGPFSWRVCVQKNNGPWVHINHGGSNRRHYLQNGGGKICHCKPGCTPINSVLEDGVLILAINADNNMNIDVVMYRLVWREALSLSLFLFSIFCNSKQSCKNGGTLKRR